MILALSLAAAANAVGPVSLTAQPARPFAETTGHGVQVDGDLWVENHGDEPLGIDEFALEVRDPAGRLVQRRELNSNGMAPSIRMLNVTEVPAHGRVLLFNALPQVPGEIALGSLKFVVALSRKGVDERLEAATVVTPRADTGPRFTFPLTGRVLVWDGHDLASHHRRWDLNHPAAKAAGFASNAGRYSLDLVPLDGAGQRSRGDEAVNANWVGFGQPVRSEGAGTVVAVKDDAADDRRFDPATITTPNALYGNHVVIRHGDGSYSIYGHLQQGSARVKAGQRVAAGQVVAAIGASGSALFPHLHVQRMDGPNDRSEGVPTRFSGVTRPGGRAIAAGFVDSGDIVVAR